MKRALALLLVVPLAGCWEPPVTESVDLVFDAKGASEAVVVTSIGPEGAYEGKPKARERILEAREAARCGDDAWTRQLERLAPATLTRSLSYRGGELRGVSRTARFEDPRALERLFDAFPLSLAVSRREGTMQLEILPGGGGRASAAEKRDALEALDRFSVTGARYLAALGALWSYLDAVPARERAVVADVLSVDIGAKFEPADEREARLMQGLGDAMDGIGAFLRISDAGDTSLDELSRRVWDPFPAPLAIEVAGRVEESAGFRREGERRFVVPPVSLQGALATISGRWVAPDPMEVLLGSGKPDLDAFMAARRVARRPPTASALREALEGAMAAQPVYRLRWTLPRG